MSNSNAMLSPPVTLIGAAPVTVQDLQTALDFAPVLIAADGGADRALALGALPSAVYGDLDSISPEARARLADRLHPIDEQVTTDFDKALRQITAPFVLAVGFEGERLDHTLATLSTLAAHPDIFCILIGASDITLLAPAEITLELPVGTRVSLYPLAEVMGESEGLEWPINGLSFAPDGQIGTSNRSTSPQVRLRFSGRKMLLILPKDCLAALIDAFWRSRARGG